MSIRKREWTTARGELKTAWVVDYADQGGRRRLKTFSTKKASDAFAASAKIEIRAGIHTADSASVTINDAGAFWLATAENAGLEPTTIVQYRQHLRLHIEPLLGSIRLS